MSTAITIVGPRIPAALQSSAPQVYDCFNTILQPQQQPHRMEGRATLCVNRLTRAISTNDAYHIARAIQGLQEIEDYNEFNVFYVTNSIVTKIKEARAQVSDAAMQTMLYLLYKCSLALQFQGYKYSKEQQLQWVNDIKDVLNWAQAKANEADAPLRIHEYIYYLKCTKQVIEAGDDIRRIQMSEFLKHAGFAAFAIACSVFSFGTLNIIVGLFSNHLEQLAEYIVETTAGAIYKS